MSSAPPLRIQPVILSGGAGTRLWPLSRQSLPKQFLPLLSESTMLQDTAARVRDPARFADPILVCSEEHRFIVAEQMRASSVTPADIILEPVGRNTAPAAAVAALRALDRDPGALLLILPSDHAIAQPDRFQDAVATAATLAAEGHMTTFGIVPRNAETGYGWIRRGDALQVAGGAFAVTSFIEKPDRRRAEAMLADGAFYWNSGMFLFPAARFIDELERHRPDILAACRTALASANTDLDFLRLDRRDFAMVPAESIDYAVMEKLDESVVVPVDMGWSDVGSWAALLDAVPRDGAGNYAGGDTVLRDVRNSYVRSDSRLVAVIGVEDVIVVETADAVLVAGAGASQDVRLLAETLKAAGRPEATSHRRHYRPWGYFEGIDFGERFQVKRISVNPGESLSLQMHHHRAEHWVVVNGTARVVRDAESFLVRENESVYIPIGATHRLENPGILPLGLIEVQCGPYLGEDDIIRFDDIYGRGKPAS